MTLIFAKLASFVSVAFEIVDEALRMRAEAARRFPGHLASE